MEAETTPRDPPDDVKRLVRQRCGFGCVECGAPIYHYDHMFDFAEVRRHRPEEITLLCPNRHDEKSRGRLPLELVQQWNASPFNARAKMSKPHPLHYFGNACEFVLGSNTVFNRMGEGNALFRALTIDGRPLLGFRFEQGRLLLNLAIYDHKDQPLFLVEDGELTYRTDQWDIEWVGQTLTVRNGRRKPIVEIRFAVPDQVIVRRARFRMNGIEYCIEPTFAVLTNRGDIHVDVHLEDVWSAVSMGDDAQSAGPAALVLTELNRSVPPSVREENVKHARREAASYLRARNLGDGPAGSGS
ncbi:hypothetical protein [Cellulomonas dongxiuzhuiae]|uniref:hypothetical protein n=1 Tax=Cellulomonas dongxiuzhuiae TaxID=2819979 RepID=UPI001AAF214D|nr:hypothetical protein [Cellulomonas dongxiuzhuiae]MBO3089667.1 hypothetical protein [Cellulomonas dongxiuzhuiae]